MKTKNLLSIDTNAKTVKGQKLGFMTGILYMAPASLSGVNLCPMAEIAQCDKACLYSAGRGAFNSVQQSRMNKAQWFNTDRGSFMEQLVKNVQALIKKASKSDMVPLVRLNGTTDIRWENIPVTIDNVIYSNIMLAFPDIQFYDYTKIANRKELPSNYDLTFSYSGVIKYQKYVNVAIDAGMRIAVVFRKREQIPSKFLGLNTVDGDNSDIRHLDPHGAIVALYAKGAARKDSTGFVVDVAARRVIGLQAT